MRLAVLATTFWLGVPAGPMLLLLAAWGLLEFLASAGPPPHTAVRAVPVDIINEPAEQAGSPLRLPVHSVCPAAPAPALLPRLAPLNWRHVMNITVTGYLFVGSRDDIEGAFSPAAAEDRCVIILGPARFDLLDLSADDCIVIPWDKALDATLAERPTGISVCIQFNQPIGEEQK